MRRTLKKLAIGLAVTSFVAACAKAPYTGRSQFNLVPDTVMHSLGKQAFSDVVSQSDVERSGRDAQVLERVGKRISNVVNEKDYAWRFALIDEDQVNAWALPGGYIGFYKGILPVLESEAGMAFVMGHEVGHTTANHGAERLSQQLALVGGLTGLQYYLSGRGDLSTEQQRLILGAIGLGAQVGVLLPFSRTHEAEADVIGMMYMARAGYPPAESLDVWNRMEAAAKGSGPPEFLSTHPSPQSRRDNLREWLPRAQKRYKRNALGYDTTATLWTGDPGEVDDPVRRTTGERRRQTLQPRRIRD